MKKNFIFVFLFQIFAILNVGMFILFADNINEKENFKIGTVSEITKIATNTEIKKASDSIITIASMKYGKTFEFEKNMQLSTFNAEIIDVQIKKYPLANEMGECLKLKCLKNVEVNRYKNQLVLVAVDANNKILDWGGELAQYEKAKGKVLPVYNFGIVLNEKINKVLLVEEADYTQAKLSDGILKLE